MSEWDPFFNDKALLKGTTKDSKRLLPGGTMCAMPKYVSAIGNDLVYCGTKSPLGLCNRKGRSTPIFLVICLLCLLIVRISSLPVNCKISNADIVYTRNKSQEEIESLSESFLTNSPVEPETFLTQLNTIYPLEDDITIDDVEKQPAPGRFN